MASYTWGILKAGLAVLATVAFMAAAQPASAQWYMEDELYDYDYGDYDYYDDYGYYYDEDWGLWDWW